jgi:hypothetical protein
MRRLHTIGPDHADAATRVLPEAGEQLEKGSLARAAVAVNEAEGVVLELHVDVAQ